jgi:hypothetical protein
MMYYNVICKYEIRVLKLKWNIKILFFKALV